MNKIIQRSVRRTLRFPSIPAYQFLLKPNLKADSNETMTCGLTTGKSALYFINKS